MAQKRTLLRRIFGYGGLFSLAFALTLYWSFPYELVASRALDRIEAASGLTIEVGRLRPYWFTGLSADAVTVRRPPKGDGAAVDVSLDRLTARIKPLDSLFGGLAVGFTARNPALDLEGSVVRQDEQVYDATVDLERLDLGALPIWKGLGVEFAGVATGTFSGSLPAGRVDQLNGELELRLAEAAFQGGNLQGFSVPAVQFGDVLFELAAEEGRLATRNPIEVHSGDLDAIVEGSLELRPNVATSRADLSLKFKPTDAFWERNEQLAGLARQLLQRAEGRDGYYGYRLRGVIGRPSFVPQRD